MKTDQYGVSGGSTGVIDNESLTDWEVSED